MATWYLKKAKQLMNFETFQKLHHGNTTFVECYGIIINTTEAMERLEHL